MSELILALNAALQEEYTDIFVYARHADKLKGNRLADKFEICGRMEIRHADNLSQQIRILGGEPSWQFLPLGSKKSFKEMLLFHLEREYKGIQMYNNLIELASKQKKYQLKLILTGIRAEEEDHAATLAKILKSRHRKQ